MLIAASAGRTRNGPHETLENMAIDVIEINSSILLDSEIRTLVRMRLREVADKRAAVRPGDPRRYRTFLRLVEVRIIGRKNGAVDSDRDVVRQLPGRIGVGIVRLRLAPMKN